MTTQTPNLHTMIAALDGKDDILNVTVNGVDFTVYYDEYPSRGDNGALVPGSVTGDYEVAVGPLIGGEGVIFRQHMSPTGQGADTKGYAVRLVVGAILKRAQR